MRKDRALILDFGGVVTRTLFETHDITEKSLGLPAGSLSWLGPFDTSTDPLWVSMQRREITERQYWEARAAEVGRLLHAQAVQLLARMEDVDTMVKTAATSRSMVGDRRRWCMARPNIVTARL